MLMLTLTINYCTYKFFNILINMCVIFSVEKLYFTNLGVLCEQVIDDIYLNFVPQYDTLHSSQKALPKIYFFLYCHKYLIFT